MLNKPEFVTRSITACFIGAITLGAIIFSPWTYLLWLCIIVFMGTREYLQLALPSLHPIQNIGIPMALALSIALSGFIMVQDIRPLIVISLIPILVSFGLLKPLGHPPASSVKYFASTEIEALKRDAKWLAKASDALRNHWKQKNERAARNRSCSAHSPAGNGQSVQALND